MTSTEAYKRFQLKLNSLANQDNQDISEGEFVLIYNEQQPKWYESKFKGRSNATVIDDVQFLIQRDSGLVIASTHEDYNEYTLPNNYFDYISTYCKCSKGLCTNRRVRTHKVMSPNKELVFRDDFNKPSFECSETFTTLSTDKLQVYKTDFSIDSVFLTYYRYPTDIDILGYTHIDQTVSTNIDPELIDEYVNEIIDWCVADTDRSFKDPNAYQLSIDRLNRNTNN